MWAHTAVPACRQIVPDAKSSKVHHSTSLSREPDSRIRQCAVIAHIVRHIVAGDAEPFFDLSIRTKGQKTMSAGALSTDVESLKTRLKTIWMAGDYDRISRYTESNARDFYERLNVAPGCQLL